MPLITSQITGGKKQSAAAVFVVRVYLLFDDGIHLTVGLI